MILYDVLVAKLNRLEQLAVENRVYVEKMRKRFLHSNIVGVDNTLNELNSYFLFCCV